MHRSSFPLLRKAVQTALSPVSKQPTTAASTIAKPFISSRLFTSATRSPKTTVASSTAFSSPLLGRQTAHPLAVAPLTIRRALATVVNSPAVSSLYSPPSSTLSTEAQEQFRNNPLLRSPNSSFPDFAAIQPEHVVPAIEALVQDVEKKFEARSKQFSPTWEGTMGLTQDLDDVLERTIGIVTHLSMVKDSPELRVAYEAIQPLIVKLTLQMGQSLEFYDALVKMRQDEVTWNSLDSEQQRIVEKSIQGMKLSGVGFGLEGEGNPEKQKRFNEIQARKAQLSLKFSNNVQDATKAFVKKIENKVELEGCPESLLKVMAQNAQRKGFGAGDAEAGPWVVTLDAPVLVPFMMSCKNRDLREQVYRANVTKASEGERDNEPVINEILALRKEEAIMLGFPSYAAKSLSTKMASNVETASEVLERLYVATLPAAMKELSELSEFAAQQLNHPTPLRPWDTSYVSEEYRKDRFKYSADQISEYLVFPKVMDTLFAVAKDSFGVIVEPVSEEEQKQSGMTTWHKDVKVYKIQDETPQRNILAYFYGDFYSRSEEKKSGAWMDVCVTRAQDKTLGQVRLPIAYMICNQPPPVSESEPSRMKFGDVTTLFHEAGHVLQHLLTTVGYPQASGIKMVEWDFVEVASQFMENFAYESEWLDQMTGHYKTGEPMPKDMKQTVMTSRSCLAGLAMLRQLHFAKLDLELHDRFDPTGEDAINRVPILEREHYTPQTVFDVDQRLAQKTCLVKPIPEDRFLCAFSHIFGGGYAAGYYSYKYSELYSADAYAAVEEASAHPSLGATEGSLTEKQLVGRRYKDTILARGGATDPKLVWKEFRGRDGVQVEALLRHSGLTPSSPVA